jgi:hypothetical protein
MGYGRFKFKKNPLQFTRKDGPICTPIFLKIRSIRAKYHILLTLTSTTSDRFERTRTGALTAAYQSEL